MKEGQSAIYYITGGDAEALVRSPQLEGFRSSPPRIAPDAPRE